MEKNTTKHFYYCLSILNLDEIDYYIYAFICIVLDINLTCNNTQKMNVTLLFVLNEFHERYILGGTCIYRI